MKTYSEIDLDEQPIVVLGCGHFFTAETLDGHMGMTDVYTQDENGKFTGLRDVSAELARSVPRCPDCQSPVRQHCTQRFNRVINRAVMDEMSKRFLVDGKEKLRALERQILELEQDFEGSRGELTISIRAASANSRSLLLPAKTSELIGSLEKRNAKARKLEKAISGFCKSTAEKNQPAQKLHDAMISAGRRRSIDKLMTNLDITGSVPAISRDRQITFNGRIAQVHAECIVLADRFNLLQVIKSLPENSAVKLPGGAVEGLAKLFLNTCKKLIEDCDVEHLPRFQVEASLYYANISRAYDAYCRSTGIDMEQASESIKVAKKLLAEAQTLCEQPFQNADILSNAVSESIKLLSKQWYEPVTAEELAAIKAAMVSGSKGIATHSGHWYNCENGHPVSTIYTFFHIPVPPSPRLKSPQ